MILLSARAGEEARAGGIETGADDYVTKPFSAKELLARVQTQLYMATVRQKAAEKDATLAHLAHQQRWLESVLDLVPTPLLLMEPDRFERAISANEVSGLGLGLYIAHQIVVAHNGSIRVNSTPPDGAEFVVTLPLARTARALPPAAPESDSPENGPA